MSRQLYTRGNSPQYTFWEAGWAPEPVWTLWRREEKRREEKRREEKRREEKRREEVSCP
jgi:hypothetical protein